ncbi:antitoxin Xre/MbcA/ParS toxin-binding domain-containing protein [Enterovirga sp. GCM10030262]|uniref:antitoxin Xre/MbcA/ParS toxin-binding domain-containing protein n=1 Tax=Enterovirga sp. GCM10030262 TaxID=3273391 RepID=UPI00360C42E2
MLERLAILLDIFQAINTLLPIGERADAWMRKPNRAPLFEGRSAIDIMLDHGVEGMRKLRSYLQSQTS